MNSKEAIGYQRVHVNEIVETSLSQYMWEDSYQTNNDLVLYLMVPFSTVCYFLMISCALKYTPKTGMSMLPALMLLLVEHAAL